MAKIAVVGSGISGLTSAYLLSRDHQVTVYEASDYLGGHTHTHVIELEGRQLNVDTGFIVYNDRTYPKFIRLLDQLGCTGLATEMSFSVNRPGLEYNGHSMNTLFAQRRNLVNPSFLGMLLDILRFNRNAPAIGIEDGRSLGEYLSDEHYGSAFQQDYLVPMAAAIWSTGDTDVRHFPVRSLAHFFVNHGLVSLKNRPQWRVVAGGSNSYVKAMQSKIGEVKLSTPVNRIERAPEHVLVEAKGEERQFDAVVIAVHSDQALDLLEDPSRQELEVLSPMRYSSNIATLHTDGSLLPKRKLAWASWNYHAAKQKEKATLTYNMNILSHIESNSDVLVTLNDAGEINPEKILKTVHYEHPIFNHEMMLSQNRHAEISGVNRTHYCGAYWHYGFHEDGVVSALNVCKGFGVSL
jgi:predicted NAD/FAD-binding protein